MTARGSVLLVDDEETLARNLSRALRQEGHDVASATSASEAQRLLAGRTFDVLVVDNRMPDKTGLELIRELAAVTPEAERPQILMMTAHATVESAIEAMKLGAFDYLQKPFEVEELAVAVAITHQLVYSIDEVELSAGDRVNIECTYENDTDAPISWGDSTLDEMCFIGLGLYPAGGFGGAPCFN